MTNPRKGGASFAGTMAEFHLYVGPAIRNQVAAFTHRARVKQGGVCQACGQVRELQSVHPRNSGRRDLIEKTLAKYLDKDGVLHIPDLAAAVGEIMAVQRGVPYLWLCRADHNKYERGELPELSGP